MAEALDVGIPRITGTASRPAFFAALDPTDPPLPLRKESEQ